MKVACKLKESEIVSAIEEHVMRARGLKSRPRATLDHEQGYDLFDRPTRVVFSATVEVQDETPTPGERRVTCEHCDGRGWYDPA